MAVLTTVALDVSVLLAGAVVAWAAVGVALRPVGETTARASERSVKDLDRRFNLGPARDDLGARSAMLDGMLAPIGASLRHEQRLSPEMAHELRTPLSGVRGEAELALAEARPPEAARASFEQNLRGTDRMDAVSVSLARDGGAATFAVQDDGRGLDGAYLGQIFRPGASAAGGAGVGLPLARGGGVVAVRWAPGARFELRLSAIT